MPKSPTENVVIAPRRQGNRAAPNTVWSTATILCGLALTSFTLPSDHTEAVFSAAAVGVGLSLSIATGIEATAGVRSLIRVDILILWVLYSLTFLEFLFPQPDVDALVLVSAATKGTYAVLLGFAGLAVGRHLVSRRGFGQSSAFNDIRPTNIVLLFLLVTLLGYLHIFVAVNFDLFEALRQMSLPRFYQSWGRGRYGGDLFSLLVEVGALIYLIPPIAGLVFARPGNYTFIEKMIVSVVFLFTLYYGFSSGTRNILATYVITFLGAYFMNKPKLNLLNLLFQGVPILILLVLITSYMLEFRGVGLGNFSFAEHRPNTLYIDHNMVIVAKITDVFPDSHEFLGFEIPFNALIRPIPRVLWPGKPDSLSLSIESVAGVTDAGTSVASTFIGEAYMSGGLMAVLFASLLFGAVAEIWNRVGRNITSPFAQVLYASGFFCAAITMRSMLWTMTTMLPTLALYLYGKFWLRVFNSRHSAVPMKRKNSKV